MIQDQTSRPSLRRRSEPPLDPGGGSRREHGLAAGALAVSVLALVASLAFSWWQLVAAKQALALAERESQGNARAEISGYVVEMARLDRVGGAANRDEIVTLGRQVDTVDAKFERRLGLAPSVYRLAAQHLALATTELTLAGELAGRALTGATAPTDNGVADPLEAIQSHRVLADIAAQNLDPDAMEEHHRAALDLSNRYGSTNRYVGREAPIYTRAYAAVDAALLAQGADQVPCDRIRADYRLGRADLERLRSNREVQRRLHRVTSDRCGTGILRLS